MSFTQLYVHAVTATKYRAPIISKRIEALIYPAICWTIREKQGTVVAVGGVHDHIHVVMRMHPAVAFSQVMRHMKARSARVALQALGKPAHFWQEGYDAFAVNPHDMHRLIAYVRNQKQHHAAGNGLIDAYERIE